MIVQYYNEEISRSELTNQLPVAKLIRSVTVSDQETQKEFLNPLVRLMYQYYSRKQ